ncbi:MAG TPA: UDP-N-acetylmuramate dehydrogenase [Novimethylophilus sp.]|jgi:UDP-N-acetylmuramate dehydrogenase|uniref:UDP-N-acetylmuramate dehydrogenase n=1 Tax=Novimethylophilus sp. TaxID=2137426 RepID=UPI002F4192A7
MMAQRQATRGTLLLDEPMSRHTSWRVGGKADCLYMPGGWEDLSAFLKQLPHGEPVHFVGLGSNLLVRDGGVRGTVVLLHGGALDALKMDQGRVYAEAGVTCAKLARFAARQHLHGAEFLAGIPGTVGGALAMNAGCHGSETWDVVHKALTMDRHGTVHERSQVDLEIGYRHVGLPGEEWFVAAWFDLPVGEAGEAEQKIKKLLAKRLETQPLNMPNAGSVFRNPEGGFAARLIENCKLKGVRIGGAQVSEKHANFIVNTGEATAADIERLISHVRDTVLRERGVELQREVRIIGETL